jgi:putative transposase
MSRLARKCPPGLPVHVIQRGNNRQGCFASNSDLKAYANWLLEASEKFDVSIHAWVFMTNHVHLLMTPSCWSGISRTMQFLGRLYVRYFNFTHQRTGTLFEGRFKSSIIQNRHYLLACQRYIELNPVRAGMVDDPSEYLWSSYRAHAFGINPRMWTPHPEYQALGATRASIMVAYRKLFDSELDIETIGDIRNAANTGLVLGNELFRKEIERLTGQRQHHLKRGPKPKPSLKPKKEFLL